MENRVNGTPGTLAKFHLGLAADGSSCALVFIDEEQHSIACVAGFADLEGFITSLTQAASEMARRRAAVDGADAPADAEAVQDPGAIDVASSRFQLCDEDGTILGSLVDRRGQVVGIRLRPHVAYEMTRNMLQSARVAGAC